MDPMLVSVVLDRIRAEQPAPSKCSRCAAKAAHVCGLCGTHAMCASQACQDQHVISWTCHFDVPREGAAAAGLVACPTHTPPDPLLQDMVIFTNATASSFALRPDIETSEPIPRWMCMVSIMVQRQACPDIRVFWPCLEQNFPLRVSNRGRALTSIFTVLHNLWTLQWNSRHPETWEIGVGRLWIETFRRLARHPGMTEISKRGFLDFLYRPICPASAEKKTYHRALQQAILEDAFHHEWVHEIHVECARAISSESFGDNQHERATVEFTVKDLNSAIRSTLSEREKRGIDVRSALQHRVCDTKSGASVIITWPPGIIPLILSWDVCCSHPFSELIYGKKSS